MGAWEPHFCVLLQDEQTLTAYRSEELAVSTAQRHNATLNDLPEPLAGAEVGSTAARACPAGVPTLALAGARSVLLTNLTLALPPSLSSLRCTAAQVLPVTPVGRRERVSIYWSGSLEN